MTMTPERRQEIDTLHKMYSENLAHQPQHAVNVLVDCVRDLSIEIDSLTAENATLRAEVEHYRTQLEQTCHGTEVLGNQISTLKAEVERLQTIALCGDKSHLLVIRERDVLRTKLQAVVEAGEKVQTDTDEILYDYVTAYLPDGKKRDDRVAVSLAKIQTAKLSSDALRSALDKAKGAV